MKNELEIEIEASLIEDSDLTEKEILDRLYFCLRLLKVNIKNLNCKYLKREDNFFNSINSKIFEEDFLIESEKKELYFYIENKNRKLYIKLKSNKNELNILNFHELNYIEKKRILDIFYNFTNLYKNKREG